MDESLRTAARTGNVADLYRLIQSNGNVLRRFDRVEFIDTPLHIAAEEGCMEFAMEIMNLKPSFARKLNQQGLSPLHLAVEKGNKEIAIRLVEIDKDLVRVKGKNGETPLHYICKVGNQDGLLDKLLEACPDSIRDVTTQNRTALHVAVESERLDVLRILIRTLRKKDYRWEEINRKDEKGNTALHVAAGRNQPEMLKLLLHCKANKHATNQDEATALDVAQEHNSIGSISILRGCFSPAISTTTYELKMEIVKYLTKASLLIFRDMDNISGEDRSALLVVLGLLLTATYQATLSPPGGLWQGDSSPTTTVAYNSDEERKWGTSVVDQFNFLLFYIPTYVVFIVTFFLTLALLKPFPSGFRTALQVLLAFLALCFDQSISIISPTEKATVIISIYSAILFILLVFMCITHRVSKLSVSILGFWIYSKISVVF